MKNKRKIINRYILLFILFCLFIYILSWKSLHINVDLCLKKDTFKKYNFHIEETLSYDVDVIDKGKTSYIYKNLGGRKYIKIRIAEENNTELNVFVSSDTYDSIDIGDKVHFERKVYYTLTGLRLKCRDSIGGRV